MTLTPRPTQPRRWTSLAIASVTLATAAPALAYQHRQTPPVTLSVPEARLWLVQDQGGEAGEAGITDNATSDAAYLAELLIIEGHMLAARDLYARGQAAEAVELSVHPQEEGSLAALVTDILAHNAPDPTAAIAAFTATMQNAAPQAEVDAALAAVSQAFATAAAVEDDQVRARFDAVVLLLKAAAGEYAAAIEGGTVTDAMGWHEAYSFVALARLRMQGLAALPLSAKAAPKAAAAMDEAQAAFGDIMAPTLLAGDPEILASIAARVELIASSVR